jgi:3-hydroxybutyryl-CoA dehydrogenase
MNPAPFVPSAEVIPSALTDPSVVAEVGELMRGAGKAPTVVGDFPGFVANRLQYALFPEAVRLTRTAWPAQRRSTRWCATPSASGCRSSVRSRVPTSPASTCTATVSRRRLKAAYDERIGTPTLLVEMVEQGRRGLKSGDGFYEFVMASAEVARHRDRAYVVLNRLRDKLGTIELVEHPAQER